MDKIITKGLDEVLNKDEVKTCVEAFIKEDLNNTRFVLIIEIMNDSSCTYRRAGQVSGLELMGMVEMTNDIVTDLLENNDETT